MSHDRICQTQWWGCNGFGIYTVQLPIELAHRRRQEHPVLTLRRHNHPGDNIIQLFRVREVESAVFTGWGCHLKGNLRPDWRWRDATTHNLGTSSPGSCFHTCTELHMISWLSLEGLNVTRQTSRVRVSMERVKTAGGLLPTSGEWWRRCWNVMEKKKPSSSVLHLLHQRQDKSRPNHAQSEMSEDVLT